MIPGPFFRLVAGTISLSSSITVLLPKTPAQAGPRGSKLPYASTESRS